MKKVIVALAIGLASIASFAEATFDQIEGLIQQQNYSAAAAGLEVIIQNHPKSAKAFYAMAQAQAGLGNLEKAKKALDIATGLNPTLDFAPSSSVASLRQAITPQVSKIEVIEETHFWRNFGYFALFAGFGVLCYFMWTVYARRIEEEAVKRGEEDAAALKRAEEWAERQEARRQAEEAQAAKEIAEYNAKQAAEAALKSHKNYGKPGFDPSNPDKLKTKKQLKEEADAQALREAKYQAERAEARANEAEALARAQASYARSQPSTTVVNNSSNDLLTGVLIGNMMSGHDHHSHDTTIIRETTREVPSRSNTWDDTPAPSRSSTWDDTPSTPSKSSSWDDDSSSKSSSSWSSSSSSDSSSSWSSDSGSSSSSSSWD